MTPYRIAIMNDDMVKVGYVACKKEQKRTKFMKSTLLRTFKVKFLTCINSYNFCILQNLALSLAKLMFTA